MRQRTMLLVGDGRKSTGREKAHNTFFAVLDRIAEIVEAFPCLYFRVRLAFRTLTAPVSGSRRCVRHF